MKNLNLLAFLLVFFLGHKLYSADFQLVCPPDITISCDEDYSDLNRFGKAYTDTKGYIQWQHSCKVVYDLNSCGIGTIKRTWGVEDLDWKWVTCTQVITLVNNGVLKFDDITWPQALVIESCNPEAELKKLARPYDRPYYPTTSCTQPMYTYSEMRFVATPGCIKVMREWKVIDWCLYHPIKNPYQGIYTNTQIIKLITTSDSLGIQCKNFISIDADKECDGAQVNFDTAKFVSKCPIPYNLYNTSKYAINKGSDASGFYPIGQTKFYFIAEYACGKETKCEVTVEVKPKKLPTPYCLPGIVLELMPVDNDNDGVPEEGMVEVWASDLNKGSYSACKDRKLSFSFSADVNHKSQIFTCKNIGVNEVEMWVTDQYGNQDFCKTKIEIQNNLSNIPDCRRDSVHKQKVDLALKLSNPNDKNWTYRKVELYDNTDHTMMSANLSTNETYIFSNSTMHNSFALTADQFNTGLKYIDYQDVKKLKEIILQGISQLSPEMIIAADINQDKLINVSDLILLEETVAHKGLGNSKNLGTKLIEKSHKYLNPDFPFDEAVDIMEFELMADQKDVYIISIGDLNSSEFKKPITIGEYEKYYTDVLDNEIINVQTRNSSSPINLGFDKKELLKIECFDLQGKLIYVDNNPHMEKLHLNLLPAVYILKISGKEKTIVTKLAISY